MTRIAAAKTQLGLPVGSAGYAGSYVPLAALENQQKIRATSEAQSMFFTGEDMLPVIMKELTEMKKSVCGYQYNADHTELFGKLCSGYPKE
jgi:hypothetical protein